MRRRARRLLCRVLGIRSPSLEALQEFRNSPLFADLQQMSAEFRAREDRRP